MNEYIYGENLRNTREEKKLSQEDMSYLLDISQATYSRIEGQAILHDREVVHKIAETLGVLPFEKIAVYEEIDPKTMCGVYGSGMQQTIAAFWKSPIGKFALLVLAATFVNMVYLATQGFFGGLAASETIITIGNWMAALATVGRMVYWWNGRKKISTFV